MFFFGCSCLGRRKKSCQSFKEANEPTPVSFQHRSLSRRSTGLASESGCTKSRRIGSLNILSKSESLDQVEKDGCISPVEPSESDLMSVASLAAWKPLEVLSTGIRDSSDKFGCGSPAPSVNLARLTMKPHLELNFGDFSPEPKLTINLEGPRHASAHRRTYSDDPFAPPTPGIGHPFGTRASAEFCSRLAGSLSARPFTQRSLSQPATPEPARLPTLLPSLPQIERLPLLDLSDWTSPTDGEAHAQTAEC